MSKRFRERKRKANQDTDVLQSDRFIRDDGFVVNSDNVGVSYFNDLEPYDDGTFAAYLLPDGYLFPTPVEYFQTGNNAVAYTTAGQGDIGDNINREIGGVSGDANGYLWSTGVVSSDAMENFWLDGKQAIIRRMDNPGGVSGPVATSDHNALLAMAYAQMANQYYPSEESQYDLIRSV
jgi:hypothetical protein